MEGGRGEGSAWNEGREGEVKRGRGRRVELRGAGRV